MHPLFGDRKRVVQGLAREGFRCRKVESYDFRDMIKAEETEVLLVYCRCVVGSQRHFPRFISYIDESARKWGSLR